MTIFKPRQGQFIFLRAKVIQPGREGRLIIETPHGRAIIDDSMVTGIDEKDIERDSIVESTLPNREGIKGVVRCIDGDDVMVRWATTHAPQGSVGVEKLSTLKLVRIKPM